MRALGRGGRGPEGGRGLVSGAARDARGSAASAPRDGPTAGPSDAAGVGTGPRRRPLVGACGAIPLNRTQRTQKPRPVARPRKSRPVGRRHWRRCGSVRRRVTMGPQLNLPVADCLPWQGCGVFGGVRILQLYENFVAGNVDAHANDVERRAVFVLYVGAIQARDVEHLKGCKFHRLLGLKGGGVRTGKNPAVALGCCGGAGVASGRLAQPPQRCAPRAGPRRHYRPDR